MYIKKQPAKFVVFYGNFFHKIYFNGPLLDRLFLSTSNHPPILFISVLKSRSHVLYNIFFHLFAALFLRDRVIWIPCSSALVYQLILILSFGHSYVYSDGLGDLVDPPPWTFRLAGLCSRRRQYVVQNPFEYVAIIRNFYATCAKPSLGIGLEKNFAVVNLKYPVYLPSDIASNFLLFIIEHSLALCSSRGWRIVFSAHKSFNINMVDHRLADILRTYSAVFDHGPIVHTLNSTFCRSLLSTPSGVVADSLALSHQPDIVLFDPRYNVKDSATLARLSRYIDLLLSISPSQITLVSPKCTVTQSN
jgi:hypothetical protein